MNEWKTYLSTIYRPNFKYNDSKFTTSYTYIKYFTNIKLIIQASYNIEP